MMFPISLIKNDGRVYTNADRPRDNQLYGVICLRHGRTIMSYICHQYRKWLPLSKRQIYGNYDICLKFPFKGYIPFSQLTSACKLSSGIGNEMR